MNIFVDSQAALKALIADEITSITVSKAIKNLNNLGNKCKNLKLVWIIAHVGYEGNEEADRNAKEAAKTGELLKIQIPKIELKNRISEHFQEKWNKNWCNYKEARQTKHFFPELNPARSNCYIKLSRLKLGKAVRIITGHNNLNYHMSKMCPGFGDLCRFCEESKETFFHFLTECPRFLNWRIECFQKFSIEKEEVKDINVEKIMEFAEDAEICLALEAWEHFNGNDVESGGEEDEITVLELSQVSDNGNIDD